MAYEIVYKIIVESETKFNFESGLNLGMKSQ